MQLTSSSPDTLKKYQKIPPKEHKKTIDHNFVDLLHLLQTLGLPLLYDQQTIGLPVLSILFQDCGNTDNDLALSVSISFQQWWLCRFCPNIIPNDFISTFPITTIAMIMTLLFSPQWPSIWPYPPPLTDFSPARATLIASSTYCLHFSWMLSAPIWQLNIVNCKLSVEYC